MKKPKRFPIALNLPHVVALLIVFGRHVVQKMTGNTWFPTTKPTLPDATKHLDDLEASEARVKNRDKGAVESRDLAEKVVVADMVSLKGCVAQVVVDNPGSEYAIIASSGFESKRARFFHKPPFSAAMTGVLQEVVLRAKAVAKHASYEWQMSTDGGKTWSTIGFTTVATIKVPGLTVGTTYLFRFRTTVKATTSDWSQALAFVVR